MLNDVDLIAMDGEAAADALFMKRELGRVVLHCMDVAVLSMDRSGAITFLNEAAEVKTGLSLQEARGRHIAEAFRIIDRESRDPVLMIEPAPQRWDGGALHHVLIGPNGAQMVSDGPASPIVDRSGNIVGSVIVLREERARGIEEAADCAHHDFLTGLPNRAILYDRLNQSIALAERQGGHLAILFLDLDDFKAINDSCGHSTGDEVLRHVAQRLTQSVRRVDTVSRWGGDEFVILLSQLAQATDAAATAENILALMSAPFIIDHHRLHLGGSIGVSVYPEDGRDTASLIRRADAAMYQAKFEKPAERRLRSEAALK